jgi:hypothetical protein
VQQGHVGLSVLQQLPVLVCLAEQQFQHADFAAARWAWPIGTATVGVATPASAIGTAIRCWSAKDRCTGLVRAARRLSGWSGGAVALSGSAAHLESFSAMMRASAVAPSHRCSDGFSLRQTISMRSVRSV